jgi:hypothetical protein
VCGLALNRIGLLMRWHALAAVVEQIRHTYGYLLVVDKIEFEVFRIDCRPSAASVR